MPVLTGSDGGTATRPSTYDRSAVRVSAFVVDPTAAYGSGARHGGAITHGSAVQCASGVVNVKCTDG